MKRELKTVKEIAAQGVFSADQLRWMMRQGAENGMEKQGVIIRIGRRLWIDADAFDRWIDVGNLGTAKAEKLAVPGALDRTTQAATAAATGSSAFASRQDRRFTAAVAAMQALLSSNDAPNWTGEEIAADAVGMADALLAALAK